MFSVLVTVLPVFIILAAGYASVRLNWLKPDLADNLNAFSIRIAIPALLFRAMYTLDFGTAFYPPMLLAFYAGAVLCFMIAIFLARLVWEHRPGDAVAVGFTAMFSNTVLLGVPIVTLAFGEAVLTPSFGIISLHAPLLYAIGMLTMELSRRDGRSVSQALADAARSIFSNPLMIAVVAGAAFNFSGVGLPAFLMTAVRMLADAAIPAALVGMGAALTRYSLRAEFSESLMVSVLSLILHPAIALLLTHYTFGLSADYVRAAVIIAAMPPGMNVYIFAVMYNRAVALSASALLIATALSVLTISFWLLVVHSLFP